MFRRDAAPEIVAATSSIAHTKPNVSRPTVAPIGIWTKDDVLTTDEHQRTIANRAGIANRQRSACP